MRVRNAEPAEVPRIEALVASVVDEIYGHLFHGDAPRPEGDFERSLVAIERGQLVGVALTRHEWLDDLWIAPPHRGHGVGRRLLAAAEAQIASRALTRARLRVIAENDRARRFYLAHGWAEVRSYPHERYGFPMIELEKPLT
jgi:GNAT superfamily N-acetyltransferase